jgi:hypothetical protein
MHGGGGGSLKEMERRAVVRDDDVLNVYTECDEKEG